MWSREESERFREDIKQVVILAKRFKITSLEIYDLREKLKTTDNTVVEAYFETMISEGRVLRRSQGHNFRKVA